MCMGNDTSDEAPSPAPTCSQYQRKARCCSPKSIKEPICPDKDTEHAQIEEEGKDLAILILDNLG